MLIREILEEVAPLMIGMLFQRLPYIGCLLPAFGSPRKLIRQRIASKNEVFVDPNANFVPSRPKVGTPCK